MADDEIKDELKALEKEVKALKKLQDDTKQFIKIEQDPRIDKIIASIKKLEQKVK